MRSPWVDGRGNPIGAGEPPYYHMSYTGETLAERRARDVDDPPPSGRAPAAFEGSGPVGFPINSGVYRNPVTDPHMRSYGIGSHFAASFPTDMIPPDGFREAVLERLRARQPNDQYQVTTTDEAQARNCVTELLLTLQNVPMPSRRRMVIEEEDLRALGAEINPFIQDGPLWSVGNNPRPQDLFMYLMALRERLDY